MYGGAALAPLGGRLVPVTVSGAQAARIYLFNVERWIGDDSLEELRPTLAEVASELRRVQRDGTRSSLSWVVRQVVLGADD